MKAIYLTCFFYFSCFYTAQATTPEKEALSKELKEIRHLLNTEDYDKALIMSENFEKNVRSKYPDLHSKILIFKAYAYIKMDMPDSTNIYLDRAEVVIDSHGLDSLKAHFYRQKGLSYYYRYDFKSSIPIFLEGLRLAKKHDNVNAEMFMSFSVSKAYKNVLNQDSAKFYINQALNIARKENSDVYIADCNTVIGGIEKSDGNFLKAMEHFFEAYSVAKIVYGDTERIRIKYFVNFLLHIYYDLGNLPSTLEMLNSVIDQKKITQNLTNMEALLITKSSVLLRMDSLELSALILAEVEESHQVSKNPRYHNQVVALKGGLLYKKKQWDAAEVELSKLLPEVDSASTKSSIEKVALQGLSQLAQLKLRKGDYKKSISICEKRLKSSLGHEHKKQFYGTLAACYQALGNEGMAYDYLLRRDAIRDTIDQFYAGSLRLSKEQEMLDQQNTDEIEKLKYQNELSQVKTVQQRNLLATGGVLTLLISGILYLWGRQRKLVFESELVDVKQRLLRQQINPHFIFNVLNSIQNSVLTLKKEKSIELISKFSKLIRQILQNSDKMKVSIHEELSLLTNYMDLEKVRTRNKFDYEVSIDEGIDIHNAEIPSMILQLFVENAIWHGILPKEERGLIKVIVEKEEDRIKVIIDDDGVGRKMSAKLKTKDQQENVSMGMYLVRQRIQTLNKRYQSNIDMYIDDGKNGKGTQVLLIA